MAFAEFPYGFLVARRDDGLFFAVVFLGAALADELEIAAVDGRDDRAVVRWREREFEQMKDSCESCGQALGKNGLVFAVVFHFSPPCLPRAIECAVPRPIHTTQKQQNKYIYKKQRNIGIVVYICLVWLEFQRFHCAKVLAQNGTCAVFLMM